MYSTIGANIDLEVREQKKASEDDSLAGARLAPYLGLLIAAACVLCRPNIMQDGTEFEDLEEVGLPQKISHVDHFDFDAQTPGRSLRGCCGEPVEFRWAFTEGGSAVGEPLRTRILALDASGRPASAFACSLLRFNIILSGRAQLARPIEELQWQGGELQVDIDNFVAEVVDAEMRIESPNPTADVLLFSATFQFVPGLPEEFKLDLRPLGSQRSGNMPKPADGVITIPSLTTLDVVLEAHDRFGNRVSNASQKDVARLMLRTSTRSLSVVSFFKVGESGEARARIRSSQPGLAELWLESDDGRRSKGRPLRDQTVLHLNFTGHSATPPKVHSANLSARDAPWAKLADEVRSEFLHAWDGYRTHAWGNDELEPLAKKGKDTYGNIGIMILDSLSTLWLMGLSDEFEEASKWVAEELNFDYANREVSVFELVIRGVGGLLGAHTLSGNPVFVDRARDLADRLLPAFDTASGMPHPRWDISKRRGTPSGDPTILAEAGSVQLEFRALTALTGDLRYREVGDRSFDAIRSTGYSGLIPVRLTPPHVTPVEALEEKFAVGALADSYYEYVLKQWLQSPSEIRFKDMWLRHMEELPDLVRGETEAKGKGPLRIVEMMPSGKTIWKMDHLSCFAPGMIALGLRSLPVEDLDHEVRWGQQRNATWRRLADGLTQGCAEMWTFTKTGLAPELVAVEPEEPFRIATVSNAVHSFLRPETAESLFYLYRLTGKKKYRQLGEKMFRALVKHARVEGGYATVGVVTQEPTPKIDEMQSFVLAETFKYLYLLFSPADALDLDRYVLNTEGHPLQKLGPW